MADEPDPTRHDAPERLVNDLEGFGFHVALLVRRADGEALTEDDVSRLDASLAAFERADVDASGDEFEVPDEEEPS